MNYFNCKPEQQVKLSKINYFVYISCLNTSNTVVIEYREIIFKKAKIL